MTSQETPPTSRFQDHFSSSEKTSPSDLDRGAGRPRSGAGVVRAARAIRQLRDLTRTRTAVTRERTREIQRLEKLLEDAGIKLSSVAADLNGVSSRAMLEALLAGETDPAAMAELAKKRMRGKIPQLTEALYGGSPPITRF